MSNLPLFSTPGLAHALLARLRRDGRGGCEDTGVEDPRAPARGCLHPRLVPDLESLEPHTDRLACNLVGPVQREQAAIFQYPHTDRLACNPDALCISA